MPNSNVVNELLTEFEGRAEVSGWHFRQIGKSDSAYIYEKSFEDLRYYEVFRRRISSLYNRVIYPGSNSFGIWAWHYSEYDRALRKFNSL